MSVDVPAFWELHCRTERPTLSTLAIIQSWELVPLCWTAACERLPLWKVITSYKEFLLVAQFGVICLIRDAGMFCCPWITYFDLLGTQLISSSLLYTHRPREFVDFKILRNFACCSQGLIMWARQLQYSSGLDFASGLRYFPQPHSHSKCDSVPYCMFMARPRSVHALEIHQGCTEVLWPCHGGDAWDSQRSQKLLVGQHSG